MAGNSNGNDHEQVKSGEVEGSLAVLGDQSLAVDMARAEIDQAIATAHKFPRVLDTVIKKIETMACYNEAAAENCIYSLPRAGKAIIGPSIGFANILAGAWGNCTDGARIVHVDRKERVVVAEGGFHDLETNRKTIVPVSRRIAGKDGRLFSDDMIMVTGMAAASIARRNAILNAVPRALWFPIYERALQIVRGTVETFGERKDKALKAFSQFGVTPAQIIMALGLKGEVDLTLEHIPVMRGMYQALRDGTVTVEEMFDPRRMTGGGFETVTNPLGEEEAEAAPAKAETIDKETGEVKPAQSAAPASKKARGRPKKESVPPAIEPTNPTVDAIVAKAQEPQPAAVKPKNPAEYKAHLEAWLPTLDNIASIEDRWRQDRALRGDCSVVEAEFAQMMAIKNNRIRDLQEINAKANPEGPYPE